VTSPDFVSNENNKKLRVAAHQRANKSEPSKNKIFEFQIENNTHI
jgi:hypothetical protein